MAEGQDQSRGRRSAPPAGSPAEVRGPLPTLALPKGGGAIRGIGEKFATNPVTGTASMNVPIAVSPGRSGFGPNLALSYDSGAGNGPFGFGWRLSVPAIARKTDKGLPRYRDPDDVFVLSDAEDLVPVLTAKGTIARESRTMDGAAYVVEPYRPRVEGLFARIQRWTRTADGDVHWQVSTRDNVTSVYGSDPNSRIADPAGATRVFSWLLASSRDDRGNAIEYEYAEEDAASVDLTVFERHRTVGANRYLKRVSYGHLAPRAAGVGPSSDWCFQVVFDYGEHDDSAPGTDDDLATRWPARPDPFSSYRSGFEVRTYRRCRRVLMFHRFPELGPEPALVRSTDFEYQQGEPNAYSLLTSVTQTGYGRGEDGGYRITSPTGETLSPSVLPPLEFSYSTAVVDPTLRTVEPQSVENLPIGLDGARYQWVDLDSEGLPGILVERRNAWYYKRNLSGRDARFGPQELLATAPAHDEVSGGAQLMDLAGGGRLSLVHLAGPIPGYYGRDADREWQPFQPFGSLPRVDWASRNLRIVDLTGDGRGDVLITEDEVLRWYPSLATDGFGAAENVTVQADEEDGPRLVFADETQSVYLADLSGDGLADIVRIRNGDVCYWPSLGYGRFGAKVTMANAPWFDRADQFNHARIRLADIDGSGPTDIVYLGQDQVTLYFNLSGNGWTDGQALPQLAAPDDVASVLAVDLLGNGTACLVWSSPLPAEARAPMRYIDLMSGQKPHLLTGTRNNLGAETTIGYVASTKFYLSDRVAGRPWITRLPFPVHVVERVETYDRISGNRFVSRSAYHHGYYDGAEREFRGFGMVEQWDTQEIASVPPDETSSVDTNLDEASFVPPVLTRTWYHTGGFADNVRISRQYEHEYYREGDPSLGEPGLTDEQVGAMLLADTTLPADGDADEARQACRALRGAALRQEVYGLDDTEAADRPYTVSERNYAVRRLQARGPNQHAIFLVHARETLDLQYERALIPAGPQLRADPRVTHALTLDVDEFGNVLCSGAVGYGRRHDDPLLTPEDRAAQRRTFVSVTENRYTNAVVTDDAYRVPLLCDSRVYELVRVVPAANSAQVTNLFRSDELFRTAAPLGKVQLAGDGQHELSHEDVDAVGAVEDHPYRRLLSHTRTLFRRDDLSGPAPLGLLDARALPYETLSLALTPALLATAYDRDGEALVPDPAAVLPAAGYVAGDGYRAQGIFPDGDHIGQWWQPAGRIGYSDDAADPPAKEFAQAVQHFFLPRRALDPFGQSTTVTYDPYDLLPVWTRDPVGNVLTAEHDYRALQPRLITDPNGNRTEAVFDALGLLAGTAVRGKDAEPVGDSLAGFAADLGLSTVQTFVADPFMAAADLLGGATTRVVYDLHRFTRCGQPPFAASLARETHASEPVPAGGVRVQISLAYSDGFGRVLQLKTRAEPGDVPQRDADLELGGGDRRPGGLVLQDGVTVLVPGKTRWVGSGRTVYNNKGKAVKGYEPFFSATALYETEPEMTMTGVTPILGYDPVGRVVVTLHPDHTFEKVVFGPWRQETWDGNDTVLTADPTADPDVGGFFARLPNAAYAPTWHEQRKNGGLGADEQSAAQKTAAHAGTPAVAHLDPLGRPFATIADNGPGGRYPTRVRLDIEGNQRSVTDARGNAVMRYGYGFGGVRLRQMSADAGGRWVLPDVAGTPVRTWDSRGHSFRIEFDALRRPLRSYVRGADPQDPAREILLERIVYGEGHPDAESLNLRGRMYLSLDGAGVVTHTGINPPTGQEEAYDFKGNLLRSARRLARDYQGLVDWSAVEDALGGDPAAISSALEPWLEPESYTTSMRYDALSRPVGVTTADSSVVRPGYNDASLLDRLDVNLRGSSGATPFVTNINYNARGQRESVGYGNGVESRFTHDPLTFRIVRLETVRGATRLQDLRYAFDPAGNITSVNDDAQASVFYDNAQVAAKAEYVYDPIYRLLQASGREHAGSGEPMQSPQWRPQFDPNDATRRGKTSLSDTAALRRYVEQYTYDSGGNIERVLHQANGGGAWSRQYHYAATNNRLVATSLPGDPDSTWSATYEHDAHGNMTRMPHLVVMEWDCRDRLRATRQQVVNDGTGERTWYVYDAGGQRVRKVTERQNGTRKDERVYAGGFEVYRSYGGDGTTVTLERETLHVMDGDQRVAVVETKVLDTKAPASIVESLVRYQMGSHLGSAVLELDHAGDIITYEEYYPYGATAYQAGRSVAEGSLKRYRYTGKERDEETGLSYHGARYYAPWLGRWTAADPIGVADGPNLYQYVRGAPTMAHDRRGTDTESLRKKASDAIVSLHESLVKVDDLRDAIEVVERKLAGAKAGLGAAESELDAARRAYNSKLAEINRLFGSHGSDAPVIQQAQQQAKKLWDSIIELDHGKIPKLREGVGRVSGKLEALQKQLVKAFGHMKSAERAATGATRELALEAAKHMPPLPRPTTYRGGEDLVTAVGRQLQETLESGRSITDAAKAAASRGSESASALAGVESKAAAAEAKAAKTFMQSAKNAARASAEVGERLAKYLPLVGLGIGIGLGIHSMAQGDYLGAAKDFAGGVPILGEGVLAHDVAKLVGGAWAELATPLVVELSKGPMGGP